MGGYSGSKLAQGLSNTMIAVLRREHLFIIIMGGVVGTTVGFGAIAFRRIIAGVSQLSWGILPA